MDWNGLRGERKSGVEYKRANRREKETLIRSVNQ